MREIRAGGCDLHPRSVCAKFGIDGGNGRRDRGGDKSVT